MELIGVTGRAGAGKTTFSDMLAENENIGVIHVDDILKEIKLKYFKLFMKEDKDGERTKVNSKLKTFLYKNKFIFDLFMKFRAQLIAKPLEKEIKKLQYEGNNTIIIDDIFIKYQKRYKDLSKVFIVKRPYVARREAVQERDNLTKEEVVAVDIAHHQGNYKEMLEGNNIIKINNNGTKEELRKQADQAYSEYFVDFRDKYKQENKKEEIPQSRNQDIEEKSEKHKEER